MKKLCIRVVSVLVLLLCVAPLFVSVHAIIPGEVTGVMGSMYTYFWD